MMNSIIFLIGGGLLLSLLTFFICEEKSLKDAIYSDIKGLITDEVEFSKCFEQFNTIRYMAIYFIVPLSFDLAVANLIFIPKGLGLMEILAFTFVPSLLGSGIILLVKWSFQPVIKLISSFLFGSVYIGASLLAFSITYLLLA